MTKIDIFSGFLGAGKTTLIKKLIQEAFAGEKLVLIENEFGEIGIDGGFLQESGIEITEMNSGCICCSLVGDFGQALQEVLLRFAPDRILIEPSGVGKLSDVIMAVKDIGGEELQLNSFTTVVDARKCKMYMKNFGEFFNNQIEFANALVLSRTAAMPQDKLDACIALLREHNKDAEIIAAPWEELTGVQILEAMEHRNTLESELARLMAEQEMDSCPICEHDHCHDHHHHDHEHDHEHHHDHEHDHEHHHDHEHDHEHHHDHCHHEHEHDADEIFTSWGVETARRYTQEDITTILQALDSGEYGAVLRAKGIVAGKDGKWIHFDYVPEEHNVRQGAAAPMGRLCVIGAEIKEEALEKLFSIK